MRWLILLPLLVGCGAQEDTVATTSETPATARTPVAAEPVAAADYGAQDFALCAACHMPTGDGVAGAFPKVRNRATAMAALDGGREYLITTVTYGLMGPIVADGQNYVGVMPGNKGSMDAAQVAAALNYLVFELRDDKSAELALFSAAEVEAVDAATDSGGPNTAAAMRGELVSRHGDKWPN